MAELRSFVIGVAIAAGLLGFGALVFGAFDGGGEDAPTVRLLGTPPASPTSLARATQRPGASATPATASAANNATPPAANTATPPAAASAAPQATAAQGDRTSCDAIRGTPYRSDREREFFLANCLPTPTPTSQAQTAAAYRSAATGLANDLAGQVGYLIDRAAAPALGDASWRQFSTQAAQNVQGLAAGVESLSPPACAASAHASLLQAARQAAAAAGQMLQAINASNGDQVGQAGTALNASRTALNQAAAAVQAAPC